MLAGACPLDGWVRGLERCSRAHTVRTNDHSGLRAADVVLAAPEDDDADKLTYQRPTADCIPTHCTQPRALQSCSGAGSPKGPP